MAALGTSDMGLVGGHLGSQARHLAARNRGRPGRYLRPDPNRPRRRRPIAVLRQGSASGCGWCSWWAFRCCRAVEYRRLAKFLRSPRATDPNNHARAPGDTTFQTGPLPNCFAATGLPERPPAWRWAPGMCLAGKARQGSRLQRPDALNSSCCVGERALPPRQLA
jgi:hypothetical protein